MTMRRLFILAAAAAFMLPQLQGQNDSEKLQVAVTILPHAGLIEAVAGDQVDITVLVDEGQDPHEFNPTPRRITAVSNATIWFTAGMPFEDLLVEKLESSDDLRIVNLSQGLALRGMEEHDHSHDHDHDHDHDHAHGDFDPHTWLSPQLIELQLQTITRELSKLAPDHAAGFEANADAYIERLLDLDEKLFARLEKFEGAKFYVFHSAFGYFADAYGLLEQAIETGGKEPSPKELTRIVDEAKKDGVKLVLVQPQFSQGSARKIADAIGAKVEVIDPLDKNVIATLNALADAIESSR